MMEIMISYVKHDLLCDGEPKLTKQVSAYVLDLDNVYCPLEHEDETTVFEVDIEIGALRYRYQA